MPFEAKRAIVETITREIVIGKEDIHIALAVQPSFSRNEGHTLQNHTYAQSLIVLKMLRIPGPPAASKKV